MLIMQEDSSIQWTRVHVQDKVGFLSCLGIILVLSKLHVSATEPNGYNFVTKLRVHGGGENLLGKFLFCINTTAVTIKSVFANSCHIIAGRCQRNESISNLNNLPCKLWEEFLPATKHLLSVVTIIWKLLSLPSMEQTLKRNNPRCLKWVRL